MKKIIQRLRATKNRREFKRNSIYGDELSVHHTSHCLSKNKGDVVIGNHCDIKRMKHKSQFSFRWQMVFMNVDFKR